MRGMHRGIPDGEEEGSAMFVNRDMDEFLMKLSPFPGSERRSCDECESGEDRGACRKCIQRYLDERQTLEDIRRM